MENRISRILRIFIAAIFLLLLPGKALSQDDKKTPAFIKTGELNFFKIRERAARHFAAKDGNTILSLSEDSSSVFEKYLEKGGRESDSEYHRYKRWEWFWRDRVNADGSFPDPMKAYKVYDSLNPEPGSNHRVAAAAANWKSIGFTKNGGGFWGMGQARTIDIFPGDPNIYYVTTVGGGIWKTTDGGVTYAPIGDKLPALFCGKVLVDNQNANVVYVNVGGTGEWWLPGLGIYKSVDGGATWNPTGLGGTRASGINVKWMEMSPTDSKIIIAATNKGLYRTADAGVTWTQVRTGEHGDIIFRPGDGNTVYTATDDYFNGSEIYRSTDGGLSWIKVTSFGFTNTKIKIVVTEADKEFVAAAFHRDGVGREIYTSQNRGASFSYKAAFGDNDGGMFFVSQTNKDIMYCGWVTVKQSVNGGLNWTQITNWCCGNDAVRTEIHADNHNVIHNPKNPAEIYFTNDGGVAKFNESTKKWTELSNGLVITMYYRISSGESDGVVVAGGTQDNGGNRRNADGTWRNTAEGDATMSITDPGNHNIEYSSYVFGDGLVRTNNSWATMTGLEENLRKAGAVGGDWATPFAIDQTNPTVLVAGYQDVLRTTNRGDSWTRISTNLTGGENLQHIAIAPGDGKVIYASRSNILYRTFDTGTNWSSVNSPAGDITRIAVSPTDGKTVYITVNGGNGKRVYKSVNGGNAWTNITLNIPNDITVNCIAYEKGTSEGLYIGTPVGVFYKNASMTAWTYHGAGLPNTEINDISICYSLKKIRVGTWGRGIWEADLYTDVVTYREPENPANVVNGLNYDYYTGLYNKLPDFAQQTPVNSGGVINNFSLNFTHKSDSFAVRYTGFIDVPSDGEYTFYTSSNDGTMLYIGNTIVVNNDGVHGVQERSGSIFLKKGKHSISLEYFEFNSGEALEVSYSGPGISKKLIPNTVLYMPALRNPDVIQGTVVNGIDYKYFEGAWTMLPDFSTVPEIERGTVSGLDFGVRNRNDNYGILFTGYIDVPQDGIYTFYTRSDDGSKFFVGNQQIVLNDGVHTLVEKSGTIGLKKGKHLIRIEFFQSVNGFGLIALWRGPATPKQQIPAAAFFRVAPALRIADNPSTCKSGLRYDYYEGADTLLPDFTTLTPVRSGNAGNFDLTGVNARQDFYAVSFQGYIDIAKDGLYTFYTNSDDGSKLFIGDQLVVDNDGLHGVVEKSGDIGLKAGKHKITVQYLEYAYEQVLDISYYGNGMLKQLIPASTLCSDNLVNQVPVVTLTPPAASAGFTAPATVIIAANASDPDGKITEVDFYNGTQLLYSDDSSPYSYNWTSVASGSYTITARAYDDQGGFTVTSGMVVNVKAATVNDCNGVPLGTAYTDSCGECVGGNTGKLSKNSDNDKLLDCVDEDDDNDGIADVNDCDPLSPAIGAATNWYADTDKDGYGDPAVIKNDCVQPSGYVSDKSDLCPADVAKMEPGNCGCNIAELTCLDCNGVPMGNAYIDQCNECVGGNTDKSACILTSVNAGTSTVPEYIIVSPLPFDSETEISLINGEKINKIILLDAAGKEILKSECNTPKVIIGKDLQPGLYTVIVSSGKRKWFTKIIKR